MMSQSRHKIFLVLFIAIIWLPFSIEVHADTSEDLLSIYGKSYDLPDTSDTIESIEELEQVISMVESVKQRNEEYNKSLDKYNELQQEKLNSANKDISILSKRNNEIISEIESTLITAPWEDLMKLDAEYKRNIQLMSDIADSMNNIEFVDSYRFTEFDIASLQSELSGLEEDLAISIEAEEIGEITDIEWILDNEMKVTSKFGYRLDPITKDRATYHSGTDYRAASGTKLKAMLNGVVLDCGYSASAGNYITILVNDRIKYFVCHLSKINVEKGQQVKQYDVIGLTGGTGYRSTGPHLHLALYIDGVAVDVSKIFK